jgi:hypothetical protein
MAKRPHLISLITNSHTEIPWEETEQNKSAQVKSIAHVTIPPPLCHTTTFNNLAAHFSVKVSSPVYFPVPFIYVLFRQHTSATL